MRFSVRKSHLVCRALMLLVLGACCAWGAARAIADQSSNGAPSVGTAGVGAPAPAVRPPLWRVYYDDGVKAMLGRERDRAIDLLNKAKQELIRDRDPDKAKLLIDIAKRLGMCYLEKATVAGPEYVRKSGFSNAVGNFGDARERVGEHYGLDSLEFADACEQLADARSLKAEEVREGIKTYLGALGSDFFKKASVSELYLSALSIRERILGEASRDVMLYRRKILRQVQSWLRRCRELRREVTDVKVQYEVDPIIEELSRSAKELKLRDRELRRADDIDSSGSP